MAGSKFLYWILSNEVNANSLHNDN